jgi:hypothetical protein
LPKGQEALLVASVCGIRYEFPVEGEREKEKEEEREREKTLCQAERMEGGAMFEKGERKKRSGEGKGKGEVGGEGRGEGCLRKTSFSE